MMWVIIFLLMLIAAVAGFVYLVSRLYRFQFVNKISKGNKKIRIVVCIAIILVALLVIGVLLGYMNAFISMIHLVIFWLISDFILKRVEKLRKKPFKRYYAGAIALLITCSYLIIGWICANHVWTTTYSLQTDKSVGKLRVVQIADSHIGTTFDGHEFATYVKRIQRLKPDVVVITGDFVDDDTSKKDMLLACKALNELSPTYGIYYSFGNHDKGYYGAKYRGYSGDDLVSELTKNGVNVLQDENVLLDNRFYIIGRQDASENLHGQPRADIQNLVKDLDSSKYSIVLNHQPNDYKNEATANVDLVLSGHTHGGQLFPIGIIGELVGANDKTYGIEKRKNTNFIVTSGISDWALGFKIGCISEIVVIDITGR